MQQERKASKTYLPSLEPDTGVEADIIEKSRIDKRQSQVWHPTQFN